MEIGFPGAKAAVAFFEWFGDLGMFCGRLVAPFFVPPYEIREFARQFDELGAKSLPLAALAGGSHRSGTLPLDARQPDPIRRQITSSSGHRAFHNQGERPDYHGFGRERPRGSGHWR